MIVDNATNGGTVICLFSIDPSTKTPKFETYMYYKVSSINSDGYTTIVYNEAERARQARRRLGNMRNY